DPASGAWNMDTCASSNLNDSVTSLRDVFNTCIYPSVSVCDGHTIPVTNTGHSILPTPHRPLHLNNVLITPHIVKNLIYVHQFVRNINCTVNFDAFRFFVKDFMTRRVLLRCDITGDLYPITQPSPILMHFLPVSIRGTNDLDIQERKYATEIFVRAGMVNCNSRRTPVDTVSKLGDDAQHVCLYMHDHRQPCFSALKRVLRYVRGTMDYVLQLFSSSTIDLAAYLDADWAGCPTTQRSTSGYYVFLGNNVLSWSSKRQPTVSPFSAETEYRGVANAVAKTCWLWNLLRELHTPLSSVTLVYCDNVSAVYLSSNPVQHQRTKHIEIDIHFVGDLVVAD
nr:ribonuclease H-like domain-containing protein [Tanacetum cinerariifolium]